MLSLKSVSRHFDGLKVLQDVTLEVPRGGIFGLIGPNGAGKTTVFNLTTGLLAPSSGDILFEGQSLVALSPTPSPSLVLPAPFRTFGFLRK